MSRNYAKPIVILFLLASLIGMVLCMYSCASPGKIAARKAAKEEAARQQEMSILQKVRDRLPCDPVKVIQGKTIYLPGDSIPCPGSKPGDTVWRKCPPQGIRVDTFIKLDQAALKTVRDSLLSALFTAHQLEDSIEDKEKLNESYRADIAALRPWKTGVIVGLSALAAIGGLFGFFKLKSFFI